MFHVHLGDSVLQNRTHFKGSALIHRVNLFGSAEQFKKGPWLFRG